MESEEEEDYQPAEWFLSRGIF